MRFRTGLIIGAVGGYILGSRMARREEAAEDPARAGVLDAMSRHPSSLSARSRRMIDLAGGRGAEAIRRVRSTLQRRLEASADDLSMN